MLTAKNLIKTYNTNNIETKVLRGIDISVKTGEFISIIGRSGAGKSTLLYILSLLDKTSDGEIIIDGQDITKLSNQASINYRLNNFGFIFQEYALLPELTALENVVLPLLMRGSNKGLAYQKAKDSLIRVGLADRVNNLPSQLSGGEQQRVSISRAISHGPEIIFADEPTANLDTERSCEIMNIFADLNSTGQTIILVTHELEYAESANRILEIRDGLIVNEKTISRPGSGICRSYLKGSSASFIKD